MELSEMHKPIALAHFYYVGFGRTTTSFQTIIPRD